MEQRRERIALETAFEGGEPALAEVLEQLAEESASKVLVAPTVFAADAALMNELRAAAGEATARVSVDWLPGLGAELWRKRDAE